MRPMGKAVLMSALIPAFIAAGLLLAGLAIAGNAAPVEKTGQTVSYGTGDDGDLEKGVAWPTPRFTDNNNGTVTDNLTGLIWLKNANCFGQKTWSDALNGCNKLNSGECGLSDGSVEGDWRLPNVKELYSLLDYSEYDPALPSGHPFTGVQPSSPSYYWSSTTYVFSTWGAQLVSLNYGFTAWDPKRYEGHYVWPVRGPGTGFITGEITDFTTGGQISGANVIATPGNHTVISGTNVFVRGSYTLGGLPPGTYTVTAYAVGYETKTETGIEVAAGGTTTLNIALTPLEEGTEKTLQVRVAPANGVVNEPMTIIATGPRNDFYYKFWYTTNPYCTSPDRGWVVGEDWTTDNTFIWTPTSGGEYILVVWFSTEPSDPSCIRQMGTTYWVEESGEQ